MDEKAEKLEQQAAPEAPIAQPEAPIAQAAPAEPVAPAEQPAAAPEAPAEPDKPEEVESVESAKAAKSTKSTKNTRGTRSVKSSADGWDYTLARQKGWKYIQDLNSVSPERLNRVAIISMDRTYTYRQMFRNWQKYAEVFSALEITGRNHSRLAVFDCGCVESSFAFYAANMVGASVAGFSPAYLSEKFPLDKAIEEERITDLYINDVVVNERLLMHILRKKQALGIRNIIVDHVPLESKDMDPKLVHMSQENYKQLKKIVGVLFMDDLLQSCEATPLQCVEQENDPDAFILHTSGTTKGISKPVPLSDYAVNIAAENLKRCGKFDLYMNGSVTLCTMVCTSVYGFVNQLHEPLAYGCTVVVPPMSNTNPFLMQSIGRFHVEVLFITPFYFEAWSKMPPEIVPDFSSVKCVVIGGAYLAAEARARYKAFTESRGGHPVFINGYGMSETCGACIIQTEEVQDDSIGVPLPGVQIKIYDENDEKFYSMEDGHTGVLYIHSESISGGVIDENRFFDLETIDGLPYICTNDVVRINERGMLSCQGRANRYFVNNEGIKFNAGVIETLVSAEPGIQACAITPWYDKLLTHDTVPVLYVQMVNKDKTAPEVVRRALLDVFIDQNKAEETNLPMQCVITENIPYNANGKVDVYKITNGGVPGERYIVRGIREGGVLKDIQLQFTNGSEEGLLNGSVPQELASVWDDIRMSVMDQTVLNQAANALNMRIMGAVGQMPVPPIVTFIGQQLAAARQTFQTMEQARVQYIRQNQKIVQDALKQLQGQYMAFVQAQKQMQDMLKAQLPKPQMPYLPAQQANSQQSLPQMPYLPVYNSRK